MLDINKDLAQKAVEWIEQDALNNLDSRYTFDVFCREHGLYNGKEKHLGSGDVFIICPFHSESTPSLAINERRRIWNCLGCGKGGKYIDFLREYTNSVEGCTCTWYQKVNELVASDTRLQDAIGSLSIFRMGKSPTREFRRLEYKRFTIQKSIPHTFLELASELESRKLHAEKIKLAILLMQNGFKPEVIYQQILGEISSDAERKSVEGTGKYDLSAIMEVG